MLKQYNKIIRCVSVILILIFVGACVLLKTGMQVEVDTLDLNNVSRLAYENWDNIDALDMKYHEDVIIFDNLGTVKYKSNGAKEITYDQAMKSNYIHSPILKDSMYIGTVFIMDNNEGLINKKVDGIILTLAGVISLFIIIMIFFGYYVKRKIVEPFKKMEEFAGSIAEGNLDIPLVMEKNNLFGIFTESFDIMREELQAARKREVELKIKEKEMVASLSHDLKTPVTSIKLACELLMVKEQDEYIRGKINGINEKAATIDSLVNDLLVSSLEDLGEMKVGCTDNESKLLSDIVRKVDDKELIVNKDVPQCLINVDARRMEQIITNIISNSYKYASTKIDVDYQIIEGYLKMSVRDYGPGVDQDKVHLVTNKFFRGEQQNMDNKKTDGSGLGLYISKILIEKMNGEILCRNAEPGFEVILMIPLS